MTLQGRALLALLVVAAGCEGEPPLELGLTPAQHKPFFPIAGTVPHALGAPAQNGEAISCDSCHAGSEDFDTPVCLRCHAQDATPVDRAHSGVPDYVAADASCYSCHADGERGAQLDVASHSAQIFPIGPDDVHGDATYDARIARGQDQCSSCHQSDTDRTLGLCAACHAADVPDLATEHAALPTSFVNDSEACKSCHADTPIDPAMHPLTNHTFYDPNHHEAVCTNCHEARRGAPQPWAIDFTVATCTGCHTHGDDCSPQNQAVCVQ